MAAQPLVSAVIPTYNRATLLQRTLESVGAQDYRPIEVIVIDDGSSDNTGAVVEEARDLLGREGIGLQSMVLGGNSGPAVARNAGLRIASGSVVCFLDSDDLWRPEFLSVLVGLLDRHPSCGVAFSGHVGVDIDDGLIGIGTPEGLGNDEEGVLSRPFEHLVRRFPFITSGTLVRRAALDAVGWFDESLPIWQDADLWLRLAKRVDFAYTLAPLACYRIHATNITNRRKDWFGDQLRVTLRHLEDVQDTSTRQHAVGQIQLAQVLLQEELMRGGSLNDEYAALLYNEFAPPSLRFRLGRLVMRGPQWFRRPYAAAIRSAGTARRRARPGTTTFMAVSGLVEWGVNAIS